MKGLSREQIKALGQDVYEYISEHLKAYRSETIVFENGTYHYGVCLKAQYAPDHKYIGQVYADEWYTEEERMENYINCFHDYPIQYKGRRDYRALNKYEEEHKAYIDAEGNLQRKPWNVKLIDGEFVFA